MIDDKWRIILQQMGDISHWNYKGKKRPWKDEVFFKVGAQEVDSIVIYKKYTMSGAAQNKG